MPKRTSALTAAAGEYYVAFQLSARGYSVGIPRANTPAVDLLVANETGTKTLAIQVKTSSWARRDRKRNPSESHWEWDVGKRAVTLRGDNLFYAFVDLRWAKGEPPVVFFVPSNVVADEMGRLSRTRYMFWIYDTDAGKYRERWDIIERILSK